MNDTIEVGQSAEISKTITETDVYLFAGICGDFNPIHVCEPIAKESIFGGRIAHGMLVASLISNILGNTLPGAGTIYLEQNLKFLKPVKIGDTVRAVVEISEILNSDKGIVKLNNRITNQNGEMVIKGYSVVKLDLQRH